MPTPRRENRGKDSGEKEGGSDIRAALPRGLRGYPHSDALHPICLQKRIPDMFFQKISKNFSIDARKVYLLDKSCVVDIEEQLEMWE